MTFSNHVCPQLRTSISQLLMGQLLQNTELKAWIKPALQMFPQCTICWVCIRIYLHFPLPPGQRPWSWQIMASGGVTHPNKLPNPRLKYNWAYISDHKLYWWVGVTFKKKKKGRKFLLAGTGKTICFNNCTRSRMINSLSHSSNNTDHAKTYLKHFPRKKRCWRFSGQYWG